MERKYKPKSAQVKQIKGRIKDSSDTKLFIEEIEKHPIIWDKTYKSPKLIKFKEIAWSKISTNISFLDSTCTNPIEGVKHRWKQIISSKRNSQFYKKYAESLKFLKEPSPGYTGLEDDKSCNSELIKLLDTLNNHVVVKINDLTHSSQAMDTNVSLEVNMLAQNTGSDNYCHDILKTEPVEDFCLQYNETLGIDPDEAFLVSLLPDYQMLTDKQKVNFKMYIDKFFQTKYNLT